MHDFLNLKWIVSVHKIMFFLKNICTAFVFIMNFSNLFLKLYVL